MAALEVNPFGAGQPCFGCSQEHPFGFRLRFSREGDEVTTTFTPDERYQGPPGIMHGGLVTTLADEVAAWAVVGILEKFGFTAQLTCRLHKPVRIGIPVEGRSRITRNTRRLVASSVRLIQNGEDAFVGDFSFVLVDQFSAEKLLGGPLPEPWKKFCR